MNRDTLKQIMIDQKESYLNNPLIPRKYFLEENVNYCFVGIRRTGKSYMMYQKIQSLIEKGVPVSQIVYVNFEDERLLEITSDDLNIILEIGIELSGTANRPYLFFDEIQNIDGWEKFVRRMADMKYRIDITGSNSKMLSNEIASTLGGRFVILNVYPYSFSEYLVANHKDKNYLNVISTKDRAEVLSLYHEYITYGAFPELVDIRNKRSFLNSIYQTVYLGDIITRNKITNDFAVRLILKKIAESVTKPLSFSRLTNILKNAGASLGKQTVINYVGYMTDSYLLNSHFEIFLKKHRIRNMPSVKSTHWRTIIVMILVPYKRIVSRIKGISQIWSTIILFYDSAVLICRKTPGSAKVILHSRSAYCRIFFISIYIELDFTFSPPVSL